MLVSEQENQQKVSDYRRWVEESLLPLIGGSCDVDVFQVRGKLHRVVIRVKVREPSEGDMAGALVAAYTS